MGRETVGNPETTHINKENQVASDTPSTPRARTRRSWYEVPTTPLATASHPIDVVMECQVIT